MGSERRGDVCMSDGKVYLQANILHKLCVLTFDEIFKQIHGHMQLFCLYSYKRQCFQESTK